MSKVALDLFEKQQETLKAKLLGDTIFGLKMLTSQYMCETPAFIRWKRNHRKSRINKKWHKKYGAVMSKCKGVAWQIGMNLYTCPCMTAALKKEMVALPS